MRPLLIRLAAAACAGAIEVLVRLLTAVRAERMPAEPAEGPRVYYANHARDGAFVLIRTVLPPRLRAAVRPVVDADLWLGSWLRSFVGRRVFDAVLVDGAGRPAAAVAAMAEALDAGASLILYPQTADGRADRTLSSFGTTLCNLAAARPEVEFIAVRIDNLNGFLPGGWRVPIPLLCRVRFGTPLRLRPGERLEAFLARSLDALLDLSQTEGA